MDGTWTWLRDFALQIGIPRQWVVPMYAVLGFALVLVLGAFLVTGIPESPEPIVPPSTQQTGEEEEEPAPEETETEEEPGGQVSGFVSPTPTSDEGEFPVPTPSATTSPITPTPTPGQADETPEPVDETPEPVPTETPVPDAPAPGEETPEPSDASPVPEETPTPTSGDETPDSTPTETPIPEPTATPVPTETPTPEPTATPTIVPTPTPLVRPGVPASPGRAVEDVFTEDNIQVEVLFENTVIECLLLVTITIFDDEGVATDSQIKSYTDSQCDGTVDVYFGEVFEERNSENEASFIDLWDVEFALWLTRMGMWVETGG